MNISNYHKNYLKPLIILAIFSPWIKINSSLPAIRLDDILILIYLTHLLIKKELRINNHSKSIIYLIATMSALQLASNLYAAVILDIYNGITTFTSQIRNIKYILILILTSNIIDTIDSEKIYNLIQLTVFTLFAIAVMQLFNILNFNENISKIYSVNDDHLNQFTDDSVGILAKRITGTFVNPNMFGAYFTLVIPVLFQIYLRRSNLFSFMSLSIAIITMTATLSRMSILVSAACVLLILIMQITNKELNYKNIVMYVLISLFIISMIIFLPDDTGIINRFSEVNEDGSGSVNSRINYKWPELIRMTQDSVFLGHGIAPIVYGGSADSELLEMTYQYGIIGSMIYLIIIARIIMIGFSHKSKLRSTEQVKKNILDKRNLIFIGISSIALSIFASLYTNTQLATIFWIIIGISLSNLKSSN